MSETTFELGTSVVVKDSARVATVLHGKIGWIVDVQAHNVYEVEMGNRDYGTLRFLGHELAVKEDDPAIRARLEELRATLRAENISYGELAELQGLAPHIEPGDVELLEAAGVPEFPEDSDELPQTRKASPQAWKRLRTHTSISERNDIAADIAALTGGDPEKIAHALTAFPWARLPQG